MTRTGVRAQYSNLQLAATGAILIAALVYLLQFTYEYYDLSRQMVLGWGGFALIFMMYLWKKSREQPWRLLMILLVTFMGLRYIQWRTFGTLFYTGPLDFAAMMLVYLAEIYGFVMLLLGMFINVWPLDRPIIPLPEDAALLPTVDVLIPTYDEPEEIVRITATAAAQIDYPKDKLNVYILDDGSTRNKRSHAESGTDAWERHRSLRQVAAELGVGYITRETNQKAKAGNINHALKHTSGDLVLILDCDHVPTKDILKNTVGHFIVDPKVFLVQTPHFFINPSPVEKGLTGIANPYAESDLFYRKLHPAMDFWNSSYFCGSAALLRRKHLEQEGGLYGNTITEDVETAFHLHRRGYRSIYVNKPMVCGLSPETYDDYVIQRSRWAQGMIQLAQFNNPLKMKGLSFWQRLNYFNFSFFWLFGFARVIYLIAPAAYLILGFNIYNASWLQIISFTLPYVLSISVIMDFFYSGSRNPFFSEIYETIQSLFLIPAILSAVANPWKPTFKVTPKGKLNTREYLSPIATPFFLLIAFNVAALILSVIKWFATPIMRDVIAVTGAWSLYNLSIVLVSLGALWERKQERQFHRIASSGDVIVRFQRLGKSVVGKVRDVSRTGIGFEIDSSILPMEQDRIILEVRDSYGREYRFENNIRHIEKMSGRYVCGSEFLAAPAAEIISYVFGDSQRWQEIWNAKARKRDTFHMLWHFSKMGVKAIWVSGFAFFSDSMKFLWRLLIQCLTSSLLLDMLLMTLSRTVYYFYQGQARIFELVKKRPVRKFQRIEGKGRAMVYFPSLNASVQGNIMDISLSGIGILIELPLPLHGGEPVTLDITTKEGAQYQFDCRIRRAVKRGNKLLCGTEFIPDTSTYPRIVKYVYGSSLQLIRSSPIFFRRPAKPRENNI